MVFFVGNGDVDRLDIQFPVIAEGGDPLQPEEFGPNGRNGNGIKADQPLVSPEIAPVDGSGASAIELGGEGHEYVQPRPSLDMREGPDFPQVGTALRMIGRGGGDDQIRTN